MSPRPLTFPAAARLRFAQSAELVVTGWTLVVVATSAVALHVAVEGAGLYYVLVTCGRIQTVLQS